MPPPPKKKNNKTIRLGMLQQRPDHVWSLLKPKRSSEGSKEETIMDASQSGRRKYNKHLLCTCLLFSTSVLLKKNFYFSFNLKSLDFCFQVNPCDHESLWLLLYVYRHIHAQMSMKAWHWTKKKLFVTEPQSPVENEPLCRQSWLS